MHIMKIGYLWEGGTCVQNVLDNFLKVGTRIRSELARRPEVGKMRRNSHITYGLLMG